MVPDAKEYILEAIDGPEATYDPEKWDTPGFTLVLFWLAQKWQQKCDSLAHRRSAKPERYLNKEQQKACLDSRQQARERRPVHSRSDSLGHGASWLSNFADLRQAPGFATIQNTGGC
jgi:hypothetical protein